MKLTETLEKETNVIENDEDIYAINDFFFKIIIILKIWEELILCQLNELMMTTDKSLSKYEMIFCSHEKFEN